MVVMTLLFICLLPSRKTPTERRTKNEWVKVVVTGLGVRHLVCRGQRIVETKSEESHKNNKIDRDFMLLESMSRILTLYLS